MSPSIQSLFQSLSLSSQVYASEGITENDLKELGQITSPVFDSPITLISRLLGGGYSRGGSMTSPGILPLAIVFAGLILLLIILGGGYTMLLNPQNPEAQAKGKAQITWGIVGFLIVFATYWIVQILEVMFGIQVVSGA